MNERETNIIEAAIGLFMRYGVKRTSMNDISAEAGIARQTLYNAFPNKDAVLQATIRLLADRSTIAIEAGLEETDDLGDRLDVIFQNIAVKSFDLLDASPNSEDIIAGFNASSKNELEAAAERNKSIIARVLKPYTAEIKSNGLTLGQLADFVERSASAAKYHATSRKHLLSLLAVLKAATLNIARGR